MIYKTKILEIKPNAREDSGIVDTFVRLRINEIDFWATVYEWKNKNWSLSFVDKMKSLRLTLLNDYVKKISPVKNRMKPCDYMITRKITEDRPHPSISGKDIITVDFGVTVELNHIINHGEIRAGEYIKTEGRLDAHLAESDEK